MDADEYIRKTNALFVLALLATTILIGGHFVIESHKTLAVKPISSGQK
jgi:hypothetical protein